MISEKYATTLKTFPWILFISVLFYPGITAGVENALSAPSEKPEMIDLKSDKILNSIESVKKSKEDVSKEVVQIISEKDAIKKEKKELQKSAEEIGTQKEGVKKAEEAQVLKEKLVTVKKKEDVLRAREAIIGGKIRAYEKITQLVERGMRTLDNEEISLKVIDEEYGYADDEIRELGKERHVLTNRISRLEREIRSIKQNIAAKKFLLEFKEDDRTGIAETIIAQEERLGATADELALTKNRIELVDAQVEIVKDYSNSLQERHLERLKKKLLVPRKFSFSAKDNFILGCVFLLFFSGIVFWRKLSASIWSKDALFLQRFFKKAVRVFLFAGILYIPSYVLASFTGYHELVVYVGTKVGLVAAVAIVFVICNNIIISAVRFLCKDHVTESGKRICHPVAATLNPIIGWSFSLLGSYFALKVFGFERRGIDMFISMIRHPFLKLKDVPISLWIVLKAGIALWLFVVFSRLINNFLHKSIYPRTKLDESIQYTLTITIRYILFILGGFAGLRVLGIDLGALAIFAGTIGIGIGLGLQEIAKNFISGLIILFERPIKIGDYIEVGGLPGQVKSIEARSTIVDTFDNISVIVPNGEFMTQRVVNWSHSDRVIRVVLPVGVSYGSDTKLVRDSLLEVAQRHQKVLKKPEPYVWFEEFGESSLNFKLFVWTDDTGNRLQLRSDLNYMIDHIFRERKVTIAFPQRDLHIKSSEVSFKIEDDKGKN